DEEMDDLGDPTTGESDTSDFIPEDVVSGPAACDPWVQDCLEGEKCVPYASDGNNWNANRCVMVKGDGQLGDTCTWDGIVEASDSCGSDSHCWDVMDVDGQLQGVCTSF